MGERGGGEGMLGDLNPLGDGPCRSLADNGARVPKRQRREELNMLREREREIFDC